MTHPSELDDQAKSIVRYLLNVSDGRLGAAGADPAEEFVAAIVTTCFTERLARLVLGEPIDVAKAHELALRPLEGVHSPRWRVETMIRHFGGSLTAVHGLSQEEVFDASFDAIHLLLDDANMNSEELAQFEEEVLAEVKSRPEWLRGGAIVD